MTPDVATDQRALRSVALQFWVNGMVFASFVPRLPEIRDRIGVGLSGLGVLLTIGSLGGLASSALCGRVIERFGTRTTMTAGALGMISALPVIGFATAPVVFGLGLVAMHLFDVVTDVSMNIQGSRLSGRRSVPVMNRLHGLWSLGTVVGGIIATIAAEAVSLQVHLLVVAAVLLVTIGYVAPGLLRSDEGPADGPSVGSAAPRRVAALFAILAVMAIAVEMVPTDWAAIRLSEDFGLGPGPAALGFVAVTSGMVVGRFSGDWATARLGRARLTRFAALTSAVGLALATLIPVSAVSVVGFFVAGLGAAVLFPGLYDEAARAPGRPGAVLGAMTGGIRIGSLILPATVGALASVSALSVGGTMAIVAIPAAIGIGRLGGRRD